MAIRPIRPDDRERLVQAFRALDAQSIYQRFFFPKRELSDEELRQITECDGKRVVALVATMGSGERQAIVGLGQYVEATRRVRGGRVCRRKRLPGAWHRLHVCCVA